MGEGIFVCCIERLFTNGVAMENAEISPSTANPCFRRDQLGSIKGSNRATQTIPMIPTATPYTLMKANVLPRLMLSGL